MLRDQFPFFEDNSNIYLDSAASCQKPQAVIDKITNFYSKDYSSNHGVHNLANNLNERVEECRTRIASFIKAKSPNEIVFTSGATESFNLIANSVVVPKHKTNILICITEHHSNLLPWQILAKLNNLEIRYFGLTETGEIDLQDFENKINSGTFLVAVSQCSNVLGIINDIRLICKKCIENEAISVVDATQSIVHSEVDVRDVNCDFLAFSGHKIYGPTGIGVLYGKYDQLEKLNNYKVGGEMVELVTKEKNYYKEVPYRFEAGTINLSGIVGLNAATKWFVNNQKEIFAVEQELSKYCRQKLSEIEGLELVQKMPLVKGLSQSDWGYHKIPTETVILNSLQNPPAAKSVIQSEVKNLPNLERKHTIRFAATPQDRNCSQSVFLNLFQDPPALDTKIQSSRTPIFSFTIQNINSYDLAEYLNLKNISVRVGQHCTGLLHEYVGLDSTLRISLACYNTREDIDKVVEEIKNGIEKLK